mmetsp:Transcript_34379/g.79839  ORF Transcript_34379/g.79839 Transcript_34379/m.79839 type:complete len:296 (+) Transcript_34379:31-918(+)
MTRTGLPRLLRVEPVEPSDSDGRSPDCRSQNCEQEPTSSAAWLGGDPFEGCEDIAKESLTEWSNDFIARTPRLASNEAKHPLNQALLGRIAARRSQSIGSDRCGFSSCPHGSAASCESHTLTTTCSPLSALSRVSHGTGSTMSHCGGSASLREASSCSSLSRHSQCRDSGIGHALLPGTEAACSLASTLTLVSARREAPRQSAASPWHRGGSATRTAGAQNAGLPVAGVLPLTPLSPVRNSVGFGLGGQLAAQRQWRPPTSPMAAIAAEELPPPWQESHFLQSCLAPVSITLQRH